MLRLQEGPRQTTNLLSNIHFSNKNMAFMVYDRATHNTTDGHTAVWGLGIFSRRRGDQVDIAHFSDHFSVGVQN